MLGPLIDTLAMALVTVGLAVTTISLYGVLRQRDLYHQLHAAGMATGVGVITVLIAAIATRNAAIITHAALVAIFLLLTTPVASHAIARAVSLEDAARPAQDPGRARRRRRTRRRRRAQP